MAAKRTICKFLRRKGLTIILGFIIVLGALAMYIWRKLSIIRREKESTQLNAEGRLLGAAYQHFNFIWKSENDKTDDSFLDKEFYICLWDLVLDTRVVMDALHYYLLLHYELIIFIVVSVFILILVLIRTFTQRYPKHRRASKSKTRQNKNEGSEASDYQQTAGYCCEGHNERTKSRMKLYCWQLSVAVLGFSMLMSVPWEFVRLYKMKVAEKVTVVQSGIPPECVPEQMSFQQVLHSWLHWLFSWDTDPCEKYHRSLLVDPLWEIPPLLVVTTAFIHCMLHPIELMFNGMGRAFRLFFKEIPTQWQPIMLFVLMVFFLLFFVMMFGYTIHFPFLLKFEHSSRDKKENCVCRKGCALHQILKERIQGSLENS